MQAAFALRRLESDVIVEPLLKMVSHGTAQERSGAVAVVLSLLSGKESVLIKKDGILAFLSVQGRG